jgi:hypothetical protein
MGSPAQAYVNIIYPFGIDIAIFHVGGVVLFSRSLRALAKQKIRVNVICPEVTSVNHVFSLST